MIKAQNVAHDDGYYNQKIVTDDFREILVPTRLKLGKVSVNALVGGSKEISIYHTLNHRIEDLKGMTTISIGDLTHADDCDFNQFPLSFQSRVMVQHALIEAGFSGKPIRLATSLPINRFYRGTQGEVNHALIKEKQVNLSGYEVIAESGKAMPNIVSQEVLPEGVAAFYDFIVRKIDGIYQVDETLLENDLAIVDVGGRTCDVAVISGGELDQSRSDSIPHGMIDIRNSVKKSLLANFGLEDHDLTIDLLEDALLTKSIKIGRDMHSINQFIESPQRQLLDKIANFLDNQVGQGKMLYGVLFIGGGAAVLRESFKGFYANSMFAVSPLFANARGMLKYLKYIEVSD